MLVDADGNLQTSGTGGGGESVFTATADGAYLDGDVTITGVFEAVTVNTGQGANELYDMDQNVLTTSDVTFNDLTVGDIVAESVTIEGTGESVLTMSDSDEVAHDLTIGTAGSIFLDGAEYAPGMENVSDEDYGASVTGSLDISEHLTVDGNFSTDGVATYGGNATITFDSVEDLAQVNVNSSNVMNLSESGVVLVGGDSAYINGFELSYTSTTSVQISAGTLAVGDYVLSFDLSESTISVFDDGGYTYLYVDGDTPKTPTMYWSTTEPSKADDGTFYNGNDRCIGALYCDSASTIMEFTSVGDNIMMFNTTLVLGSSINPDGSWQVPTTSSSSKLPINAIGALFSLAASRVNAAVSLYLGSYDACYGDSLPNGTALYQRAGSSTTGTHYGGLGGYVDLGETRNVVFAVTDQADNTVTLLMFGYKIQR
jgi:hypothetical protein